MAKSEVSVKRICTSMLFFFVSMMLIFDVSDYVDKRVPNIVELTALDEDLEFWTFEELGRNLYTGSGYAEMDWQINEGLYERLKVKTVLTDEKHAENYKIEMAAGSFFDSQMVNLSERYAVISDKVSLELFKSYESIGESILVNGETYQVIGVSKTPTLWGTMALDNFSRIYIPYTSVHDYMSINIDAASLQDDDQLQKSLDKIRINKPYAFNLYRIVNLNEKRKMAVQFKGHVIAVIGITFIILLWRLVFDVSKNIYGRQYGKRNHVVLNAITKEKRHSLVGLFVFTSICVAITVLISFNLKFEIVLPWSVLPEENIFDIGYYIEQIAQHIRNVNTYDIPGNRFYCRLSGRALGISIVLAASSYVFFFSLVNLVWPIIGLERMNLKVRTVQEMILKK